MKYRGGAEVRVGDLVKVPVPEGLALARVVMLGDSRDHAIADERFLQWVKEEQLLDDSSIVAEWVGGNPFAHEGPRYAPVGNFMFSPMDEDVAFVSRAERIG